MIKNVCWFSCEVPVIFARFQWNLNFLDGVFFPENTQISNFLENPTSWSRVVPCGQTDITNLIFRFRNFAKALRNQCTARIDIPHSRKLGRNDPSSWSHTRSAHATGALLVRTPEGHPTITTPPTCSNVLSMTTTRPWDKTDTCQCNLPRYGYKARPSRNVCNRPRGDDMAFASSSLLLANILVGHVGLTWGPVPATSCCMN